MAIFHRTIPLPCTHMHVPVQCTFLLPKLEEEIALSANDDLRTKIVSQYTELIINLVIIYAKDMSEMRMI